MQLRLLIVLVALLGSALAGAQMIITETIDSLDLKVLNSKAITVLKFPDTSAQSKARQAKVVVEERIRGTFPSPTPVAPIHTVPAEWLGRRLLVFEPTSPQDRWWMQPIDLDDPQLRVATSDFTVLRDPKRILAYVRDLVRRHPKIEQTASFVVRPIESHAKEWRDAWKGRNVGGLRVPIDEQLERWARDALKSPQTEYRRKGVQGLLGLKSPQNISLLKAALRDPGWTVDSNAVSNGYEVRIYPVRSEAYEVLRIWSVSVEKPVVEERISQQATVEVILWRGKLTEGDLEWLRAAPRLRMLDLRYLEGPSPEKALTKLLDIPSLTDLQMPPMSLDDASLEPLVERKGLRFVDLTANPITDEGLKTIAKIPDLKVVRLDQTDVTDEGLDRLRKTRPEMRVLPEKALSRLGYFISKRDERGVKDLLDRKPVLLEMPTFSQGGPLHQAAETGDLPILRLLLDRGASLSARNYRGQTPLQMALESYVSMDDAVDLLIQRGANVNHADDYGITPLDQAVRRNHLGVVRRLLKAGADARRMTDEWLAQYNVSPEMRKTLREHAKPGKAPASP